MGRVALLVHFEPKTKSVRRAFVFLTSTAVLLIPSLIGAEVLDVHALARAVDEHYNRLRTLQAVKKPGKMRWEYRSPREKLFLSDGKDAWFYLPGDRQVRKTPVRKLDDLRSPLGFLLGKTRLEKELHGLSAAPDVAPLNEGDMVLRGVPKTMADRINQVLLEITPADQIARIAIEEVDGSITEYRFINQKENVEVADQRFRFVPPPGTEMVEGDFGQ